MTRTHPDSAAPRQEERAATRPAVLCVDDDPEITRCIERILSKFDVDVITDGCGQLAIFDVYGKQPDLIITDLRMPYGSGCDLLAEVKSNTRTAAIPVIVLSGRRTAHLPARMKALGAASFLRKPIDAAKLLAEIQRFVSLREIQGGNQFQEPC